MSGILLSKDELDVLNLLEEPGGDYVSPGGIAKLLYPQGGRGESWARPICERLLEYGVVERDEQGRYRAVEVVGPRAIGP